MVAVVEIQFRSQDQNLDQFQVHKLSVAGGDDTYRRLTEGECVRTLVGVGSDSVSIALGERFSYSHALVLLKAGKKLARSGWNGKDMFVFLVPGSTFFVSRPPLLGIFKEGTQLTYRPHIDIKNADGTIAVWVPSATDQTEDDWLVVG